MIPELSLHSRTMVRKGKSLIFRHISRIFKKTLDISESFETNLFFSKQLPKILHLPLVIFLKVYIKLLFLKKISWSQMIQNGLIRREIAKKNSAAEGGFFGGSCGTAAVFSVFHVATFNSKNFKKNH